MTYVIQEACVGVKDTACVEVCPVDCIYCAACESECPVDAIRIDDEAEDRWIQLNMLLAEEHDNA